MWFNEYEVQDMETYIKDLNLSPEVKTALSWCLGITKVSDLEGLSITVAKADGEKCERCWAYRTTVGKCAEHPTLCERCAGVVSAE